MTKTINIIDYLGIGKDEAKTRKQLSDLTGLCDRKVREAVEAARSQGHVIISSCHYSGYHLPDGPEEVQSFLNEMNARIKKLNKAKHSSDVYMYRHAVGGIE